MARANGLTSNLIATIDKIVICHYISSYQQTQEGNQMKQSKDTFIQVRISEQDKVAFKRWCDIQGISQSRAIQQFVTKNANRLAK